MRLAAGDASLAAQSLGRLAAEASDDTRRHQELAFRKIGSVAAGLGLPSLRPDPRHLAETPPDTNDPGPRVSAKVPRLAWLRVPPFPRNATLVDLFTGLRLAAARRGPKHPDTWDDVVLALGYRLPALAEEGREEDALRVARFLARDAGVYPWTDPHPIGPLAQALEAAGQARLAAVPYALAYVTARGGGGWLRMGSDGHAGLLGSAISLDREAALQTVADEVAHMLGSFGHGAGLSRHLIERLAGWGEPEFAEVAWREAFAVVAHRLPLPPPEGTFVRFRSAERPGWTVDEGLVALLLARLSHPVVSRKVAALAGVALALRRCPGKVAGPLRRWLARDAHVTSVLLVLQTLWRGEPEPYDVTRAVGELLQGYAACESWGMRRFAGMLLERAGLSGPPSPGGAHSRPASGPKLTRDRMDALLYADEGESLAILAPVWPELPEHVAHHFDGILAASEGHRERCAIRHRLMRGRDLEAEPPTPVLRWETELFVAVLHERLGGLPARLWAAGAWEPGLEEELALRLVPETALHLGLAASRVPRPPWPCPAELADGADDLAVLAADDPAFPGWVRLGIVEWQHVRDPARRYAPPVGRVLLLAGAVSLPLGQTIPPGACPFVGGEIADWWNGAASSAQTPALGLPPGPLVAMAEATDWLGGRRTLVPAPCLRGLGRLTPPAYGEPLAWSDGKGRPALALRTWRVRNRDIFDAEPADFEGSDLVVRPDVLARLRSRFGALPREYRHVLRVRAR